MSSTYFITCQESNVFNQPSRIKMFDLICFTIIIVAQVQGQIPICDWDLDAHDYVTSKIGLAASLCTEKEANCSGITRDGSIIPIGLTIMDAKMLSVETLVKHCSSEDRKQKITMFYDISDIETVRTKASSMGFTKEVKIPAVKNGETITRFYKNLTKQSEKANTKLNLPASMRVEGWLPL